MGQSILDLRDFSFSKYIYLIFVTYVGKGTFNNYVDTIMPFFDHLKCRFVLLLYNQARYILFLTQFEFPALSFKREGAK